MVTELAEQLSQVVLRGHHLLPREELIRGRGDRIVERLLIEHELASELEFADGVLLALLHVDGDVDVLLVRRDRHLGGGHLELEVTAIEVPGSQGLEIGVELGLGVLIGGRQDGPGGWDTEFDLIQQGVVIEHLVADDVDMLDQCDGAFGDIDVDLDAVLVELLDLGTDAHTVLALTVVDLLELAGELLEQGVVEYPAFYDTDVRQCFLEHIVGQVIVAFEVDLGDRWTLLHLYDQRIAFPEQSDVSEEAGPVQLSDGEAELPRVDGVTDLYRQIVEQGAIVEPLQAVDADLPDGERFRAMRYMAEHQQVNEEQGSQ